MNCARTWHEWRVEDALLHISLSSLCSFPPLSFMPATFFWSILFLCHLLQVRWVSLVKRLLSSCHDLKPELSSGEQRGQMWMRIRLVSPELSLAEGQGSWEVTVKGFFCRMLLAAALAFPCPGVRLSMWYPPRQAFFCLPLQRSLSSAPWGRAFRGGRVQLLWTLCLVLTFLLQHMGVVDVQCRYVLARVTCTSQLLRGLSSTTEFCRDFPASEHSQPATCDSLFLPYSSLLDHGHTVCSSLCLWRCSWRFNICFPAVPAVETPQEPCWCSLTPEVCTAAGTWLLGAHVVSVLFYTLLCWCCTQG